MKIAITGASGLIGSELVRHLETHQHEVWPIVRRAGGGREIAWDPKAQTMERSKLEGMDAVVHLAGENIGERRWTDAQKQKIMDSRVQGTRLLSQTLTSLDQKPSVLVSGSAIGFYGDQRPEDVDEQSSTGVGFLAEVCRAWEDATTPARNAGIRVVNVRTGVVLSPRGGALAKMLTPFRLGVGGVIGSGKQVWSWISLADVVRAIRFIIEHDELSGPVNLTSPHASTNAEFTKALGHVLGRPTLLPLPGFMARLALGEMADALLLSSSRVLPRRLLAAGFEFRYPDVEPALRDLIRPLASR